MDNEDQGKLKVIDLGGKGNVIEPSEEEFTKKEEPKNTDATKDEVTAVEPDRRNPNPFARSSALGSILPYVMAAGMLSGGMPSPFAGGGRKVIRETLKPRKCALPDCDTHFTPDRFSEICCSTDHFLLLKEKQKIERRIQENKNKKNKKKRKKK